MKNIVLLFVAVILVACSSPVQAQEVKACTVRDDAPAALVLREGPGADYKAVVDIEPGQHLPYIKMYASNGWAEVKAGNVSGWVELQNCAPRLQKGASD